VRGTRGARQGTVAAVALEITIDRELCMGSGNCAFWAPGVFDLDDDGVAYVIDATAQPDEKVLLAAQGCPTQAIAVVRDGTRIV
jgi:ferredoxin